MSTLFGLDPEHPLARELASLRATVKHYEHAANAAGLQLQRQAVEIAAIHETSRLVSQHNAQLEREVVILRQHSDPPHSKSNDPSSSSTQHSAELALLRAQERLAATETHLLAQNRTIADLRAANSQWEHDGLGAKRLVEEAQRKEANATAAQREIHLALRQAIEERNMSDHVVREYADLVKSLESRGKLASSVSGSNSGGAKTNGTSHSGEEDSHGETATQTTPLQSMMEGRQGLQQLVQDMSNETTRLHSELQALHAQLETTRMEITSLQSVGEEDRSKLAVVETELAKLRADDTAAAKLVARYMSFSQSSTDLLQSALTSARAKHAATLNTLTVRIQQAEKSLLAERSQNERLRRALDDATQDISRATYGRRREIGLRMGLLVREEGMVEALRRWVRRAEEALKHVRVVEGNGSAEGNGHAEPNQDESDLVQPLASLLTSAAHVLASIDGKNASRPPSTPDELPVGSVARLILAQDTLATVLADLQVETEGRLELMRQLGMPLPVAVSSDGAQKTLPLSPATEVNSIPPTPAVQTSDTATSAIPEVAPNAHAPVAEASPSDTAIPLTEARGVSPVVSQAASEDAAQSHSPEPVPTLAVEDLPPGPVLADSPIALHSPIPIAPPAPLPSIVLPSPRSPSPPPLPSPPTTSPLVSSVPPEHADLLAQLDVVGSRYDDLQKQLRDAHRSLTSLKSSLSSMNVESGGSSATIAHMSAIIERLDDYAEDAMVELEIRAADDVRLAEGWRTLLAVSSSSSSSGSAGEQNVEKLIGDVRGFLDESDAGKPSSSTVAGTRRLFSKKVDDLQHDIATAKFALHQLSSAPSSDAPGSGFGESPEPEKRPAGWGRWFSGSTSSRPSSPAPTSFGAVMTSPRHELRSVSSSSSTLGLSGRPTSAQSQSQSLSRSTEEDILKSLDFRIATPFTSFAPSSPSPSMSPAQFQHLRTPSFTAPASSPSLDGLGHGHVVPPWARTRTVSVSLNGARPRTTSGYGALGLGVVPGGANPAGSTSRLSLSSSMARSRSASASAKELDLGPEETETETEEDGEDSDGVE